MNKVYQTSELEMKIYETATVEEEEKIAMVECPKCNIMFPEEDGKEEDHIKCQNKNCGYEFKLEEI